MWIIFGWQKVEALLGEVRAVRGLDCQRESPWTAWNSSEWVTFSIVKFFRFVYKLQCTTCSSTLALHTSELNEIECHMRTTGCQRRREE